MIGTTISHYHVLEKLGGGGMGVVYKAEDIKLKRLVALKFLPPDLTSDPRSKERFAHEAQAASSLEHPNICTVHDIGDTDEGQTFIVMSYYDGETLKRKLSRGPLKVEQALEIAAQIADGLAKAHDNGIVHRDIKPANIMISREGSVKILDFGLAKLAGETRLTKTGSTVGTLMYMAPEQVHGQEVDARADIWALGVLLQEMITGVAPFRGEHEGALLYEIISAEPPPMVDTVPDLEPELQQLVSRCLEKDPEERYQSAKDISVDCRRIKREMKTLRQMSATYSHTGRGDSPSVATRYPIHRSANKRQQGALMAVVGILFCTTVVLTIRELGQSTSEVVPPLTGEIHAPEFSQFYFVGAHGGPPALSPDGRSVAFVARAADGRHVLWVRNLDDIKGRMINKTDDASYPFWSQDGHSIAFFSGRSLKRVDVAREEVKDICSVRYGLGGSWNRNGTILFSSSRTEPIYSVSENGGTPEAVTALDTSKKEIYHQFPFFLPDGNHFLFLARSTFTNVLGGMDEICVASLEPRKRKRLLSETSNAVYANGYLIYVKNTVMTAAPFDLNTMALTGESVPITQVNMNPVDGGGVFSVSQNNLLVYQQPPSTLSTRLVTYNRNGTRFREIGRRAAYNDVRFAPDGKQVAYSVLDSVAGRIDIYLYNPSTSGEPRRFAYGRGTNRFPVWSHLGTEMVFCSDMPLNPESLQGSSNHEIYRKSLTPGAKEKMIVTTQDYIKQPFDWTPDGKFIAFVTSASASDPKRQSDIWMLPTDEKESQTPYLHESDNEWDPRFSSDGKWIAWCSNKSGQNEIYVSRFPGPFNDEMISHDGDRNRSGGTGPRWANGSRELFYLTFDNKLMVVELRPSEAGVQVVARRELFQTNATTNSNCYDVSPDGSKIIINTVDEQGGHLVFMSSWTETLRKK